MTIAADDSGLSKQKFGTHAGKVRCPETTNSPLVGGMDDPHDLSPMPSAAPAEPMPSARASSNNPDTRNPRVENTPYARASRPNSSRTAVDRGRGRERKRQRLRQSNEWPSWFPPSRGKMPHAAMIPRLAPARNRMRIE